MSPSFWYSQLIKPEFAPPAAWFGPVWGVLYLIILISFVYTVYLYLNGRFENKVLLPFLLNLIFNVLFSPIQFGLQDLWLSTFDILLVLITLVWLMRAIYPYSKIVYYAQIPYLAWVTFATLLQVSILILN